MIYGKLMKSQQKIVEFASERKYAGIFSAYGTGKTLAALALIDKMQWSRILVVSTKLSLVTTWIDEIRQWTDFRYTLLLGPKQNKIQNIDWGVKLSCDAPGHWHKASKHTTIFLLNYDGVQNVYHELVRTMFQAIILDESTKIKSPYTDRTKVLWSLGREIRHRYAMTGFPFTENFTDVYAQIKFLDNGMILGNKYDAFTHEHFVKFGPKLVPKAKSKKAVIKKISEFCLHITNKDLKLPPSIYKQMTLEQSSQQKYLLTELAESFQFEFGKVKYDTQYIFGLINKSMQICDGYVTDANGNIEVLETPKDEVLIEFLNEVDISRNKVVIWCAFIFSIKKIENILKHLKIPVLTLTGSTKDERAVIQKFQHTKQYNVLITTQKKAAESITINNCRIGFYYSQLWSGDLRANSEARIRRKGSEKHKSILYIDLVVRGSVEEQIIKCHRQKKNLIQELKRLFIEVGGEQ